MKRHLFVMALGLASTTLAGAQEQGAWRAASKTATAITGDVAFSTEKLLIDFDTFTIAQIRPLEPAEMKAVFDLDGLPSGIGHIYRVQIPAAKKFLHKNTICGPDATEWVATLVSGRDLRLAFFSGPAVPNLTAEAIVTGTSLCGTYAYVR